MDPLVGGQYLVRCPAHDGKRPSLAIRERHDGALFGLVLGGLGEVDAGIRLAGGLGSLNEELVAEGFDLHRCVSP